jgi:hypothetical protein
LSKTRKYFITTAFNVILEYAIRKIQENQVRLKLKGSQQLLAYPDNVNLLEYIIKINTETLIYASKEADLEINAEETWYMLLSHHWNAVKIMA